VYLRTFRCVELSIRRSIGDRRIPRELLAFCIVDRSHLAIATPVQKSSSTDLFPGYQVEWDGKWMRIFRPDVECTNGVIHVIDGVFLKDSDIRVTGGASLAILAPHLMMILIAKWQL